MYAQDFHPYMYEGKITFYIQGKTLKFLIISFNGLIKQYFFVFSFYQDVNVFILNLICILSLFIFSFFYTLFTFKYLFFTKGKSRVNQGYDRKRGLLMILRLMSKKKRYQQQNLNCCG